MLSSIKIFAEILLVIPEFITARYPVVPIINMCWNTHPPIKKSHTLNERKTKIIIHLLLFLISYPISFLIFILSSVL